MKIKKGFLIVLGLKFPKLGVEADFTKKTKEISEAVSMYNSTHPWYELTIVEINKLKIKVVLVEKYTSASVESKIVQPTKCLCKFSQYLYHNGGFDSYSSQEKKLFKTLYCEELDESTSPIYGYILVQNQQQQTMINLSATSNSVSASSISDEALSDTIKFIISTQNIGNTMLKSEVIKKCKEVVAIFI